MKVREFLHPVALLGEQNTLADAGASIAKNVPVFIRLGEAWHTVNPQRLVGYPMSRRLIDVPLDGVTPVSPEMEIHSVINSGAAYAVIPVEEHGQIVGHLDRSELLDVLAHRAGPDDLTEGLLPRLLGPLLHDLSNSLTVARAAVDLAVTKDLADRRAAQAAMTHAVALIRRVREVCAGDSESPPSILDLNVLLRGLSPLVRVLSGTGIAVELRLTQHAVSAYAYRRLIERTVLNLVLNAREAMEGRGNLRLSTGVSVAGGNQWANLTVDDDGPGLTPDVLDQVLRPGYTSKAGAARGVGLSGIARALARVGGRIVPAHSTMGGARFEVYFRQEGEALVSLEGAPS